jgi:hypothetical protein
VTSRQQNNDLEHNALNARKHQSIKQNDVYKTKDDNKCTKKKKINSKSLQGRAKVKR